MKFVLRKLAVLFIFVFLNLIHVSAQQDYLTDVEVLDHFLNSVKLRKCNCKTDEVFVNGTCVPGITYVPVLLFPHIIDPVYVETNKFDVLENSGLKCGFDRSLSILHPTDFFILSTGELFHVPTNNTFSPISYCVNHVFDQELNVTLEIRVCIKTPQLPLCCKNRASSICNHVNLPLWYGYSPLRDAYIKVVPTEKVECAEGEVVSNVRVKQSLDASTYLAYENEAIHLIVYKDEVDYPKYLSNNQFCISPKIFKDEKVYDASYCTKDPLTEFRQICQGFTCIRKCCPEKQVYSYKDQACINYDANYVWQPEFRSLNSSTLASAPSNLKISYGYPICQRSFFLLNAKENQNSFLLSNGSIFIQDWGFSVNPPSYCRDQFLTTEGKFIINTLICFPDKDQELTKCQQLTAILFPILLMISCIFLLITLVVYASIPELHAKLHGRSLLSHVTALFIAYLFLAIVQWNTKALNMTLCRTFAFLIQISFLAAFFWLNTMCFDIWLTLRSMRPVAETSDHSRRRFVYYSIYSWGAPLIIGAVTLTMEMLPDTQYYSHLIRPGFGKKKCWFKDNTALWAYFYSFVSVLILVNMVLFGCVALILIQAHRANNNILRTTNKQHKERVWIYLKLFVVMGITWVCEVTSWQEGSCEYWLFTDILNTLQGFFIFLIFICKRNIFAKLRSRGTASTRKLRRMVQGSSSYGSSSQGTQQTSVDSNRKLSSSLYYHLSRLHREKEPVVEEQVQRF